MCYGSKGSCSMFGAWGDAIPSSKTLLQLRALDWVTDGKQILYYLSLFRQH